MLHVRREKVRAQIHPLNLLQGLHYTSFMVAVNGVVSREAVAATSIFYVKGMRKGIPVVPDFCSLTISGKAS